MHTTVKFPGGAEEAFENCNGSVDPDLGELVICDDRSTVVGTYASGDWVSFTTVAIDGE